MYRRLFHSLLLAAVCVSTAHAQQVGSGGGSGVNPYTVSDEELAKQRAIWKASKPPEPKYYLPFPEGATHTVTEAWLDKRTHGDPQNYHAWDLATKDGDPIVAARGGKVVRLVIDGSSGGEIGNLVFIEHIDGTVARYGHVRSGSSTLKVGDWVNRGDKIAEGSSQTGHLHYCVTASLAGDTIPSAFLDVKENNGYPDEGKSPKSGNKPLSTAAKVRTANAYRRAIEADKAGDRAAAIKALASALKDELFVEGWQEAGKIWESACAEARKEIAAAREQSVAGDSEGAKEKLKALQVAYKGTPIADEAKKEERAIDGAGDGAVGGADWGEKTFKKAQDLEAQGKPTYAIGYYERIVKNEPDSEWGKKARERLTALGEK